MQKGSIIGLIVLTVIGLLLMACLWWNINFNTPFQDVTMELGEELPPIAAFIKDGAKNERKFKITLYILRGLW